MPKIRTEKVNPDEPITLGTRAKDRTGLQTHDLTEYLINLQGTLAAGAGADGVFHAAAPYHLYRRVQLLVLGEPLIDSNGVSLHHLDRYWSVVQRQAVFVAPLATEEEPFDVPLSIPFQQPWSNMPYATVFPSRLLDGDGKRPILRVEYGTVADLGVGIVDYTATDVTAQLRELQVLDYRPAPDTLDVMLIKSEQHELAQAYPDGVRIDVPGSLSTLGGWELRAVLVEVFTAGTYTPSTTAVTDLAFHMGTREILPKENWNFLRAENKADFQLENSPPAGVLLIDAAEDGATQPGELWPVPMGQPPRVELFTNAACRVRLTTVAIRRRAWRYLGGSDWALRLR